MRVFLMTCFAVVFVFGFNIKSLLTYTFDANKNYDLNAARELYFTKKCQTCHGDTGEKATAGKRALKDMRPEDIKAALIGFNLDGGGSNSAVMGLHAQSLSHDDMDNLIAYIKGVDFATELQIEDLKEAEPEQKTKHGLFIK